MNFTNIVYAHSGEFSETSVSNGWGMMGNYSGVAMMLNWLIMILFWVLVVIGIIALVRYFIKVKDGEINSKKLYVCAECGFEYEEKQWAVKCQEWCKEKKSCNIDIIKHGKPGN